MQGMPRRYHSYREEWQFLNILSTSGAMVLGIGFLLPVLYFTYSAVCGRAAGDNPWGAKGLEWEKATSPPSPHNFEEDPVVTEEAYAYTGKEQLSV